MSWIEKVQTDMVITCGDGKEYRPDYMNARRMREFNVAEYDFAGVDGTLVDRRRPRGMRYALELYFQGEGCLEVADAFDKSSCHPDPWSLYHPMYGPLAVQPVRLLEYDNSTLNVAVVRGEVMDTIDWKALRPEIVPADVVTETAKDTGRALTESYDAAIPVVPVSDVQRLREQLNAFVERISEKITNAVDFAAFANAYGDVNALINNGLYAGGALMDLTQQTLWWPVAFTMTVAERVAMLGSELAALVVAATDVWTVKKQYEHMGGSMVLAMCMASVTQVEGITDNTYTNRGAVLELIGAIVDGYSGYMDAIVRIQGDNGALPDVYIPDGATLANVNIVVNKTITALYNIAAQAKQERTMVLTAPDNIVLLAHRLYGLLADDSTIQLLLDTNQITGDEVYELPAGKRITYYV
jgi:hypothetical protein